MRPDREGRGRRFRVEPAVEQLTRVIEGRGGRVRRTVLLEGKLTAGMNCRTREQRDAYAGSRKSEESRACPTEKPSAFVHGVDNDRISTRGRAVRNH
jgi:hypothetical protein